MSETSPIRLVCFDLGGVIIRICRTWTEGLAAAGLPLRKGLPEQFGSIKEVIHGLVIEHQTGRMPGETYYEQFSGALNGLYSPDEVERVHLAWMLEQYDGVDRVVYGLNRAGVLTAALSNTNAAHWSQIEAYPAVSIIKHRFASHEIAHHKPDDGAYAHVEVALSVRGEDVLFFDDLPENIQAARVRGWTAVHIDHAGDTAAQITSALRETDVMS